MPYKILPDLTDKQKKIIELLFKFRFLNRKHIQTILEHKDARRINAWLKDLVEKKYIGRIYSHKLLENTKPAIYYLDTNGIRWVERNAGYRCGNTELETKDVKKFYDDKHASETFRNHSLLLCDIYLQLKHVEKTSSWSYTFYTKTEMLTLSKYDENLSEKKQYMPDVHIHKIKKLGEKSTSFLLELFDPHAPRYFLKYKVNQYLDLYEEDWSDYEALDGKFPQILFILPTQHKLNDIANFIQERLERTYAPEDIVFMLTTYEKLTKHGLKSNAIWRAVNKE